MARDRLCLPLLFVEVAKERLELAFQISPSCPEWELSADGDFQEQLRLLRQLIKTATVILTYLRRLQIP